MFRRPSGLRAKPTKKAKRARRQAAAIHWLNKVLFAGQQAAAREAEVSALVQATAATAKFERAMAPPVRQAADDLGREVLESLRFIGRGKTMGVHSLSQRPGLGDRAALARLSREAKLGSSYCGRDDSLAILRARAQVLTLAQENLQEASGRFIVHVTDPCLSGSGWSQPRRHLEPSLFANSTMLRFMLELKEDGSVPDIVSFYPVPNGTVSAANEAHFLRPISHS